MNKFCKTADKTVSQSSAKPLERAKGIEPSYAAWEAAVLPLNYARGRRFSRAPAGTLNIKVISREPQGKQRCGTADREGWQVPSSGPLAGL
jgi:hypothetical protein